MIPHVVVYKYSLESFNVTELSLPKGSEVLSVVNGGSNGNRPMVDLYARITDSPEHEVRRIAVLPTGPLSMATTGDLKINQARFIGTTVHDDFDPRLVFHTFELVLA